MALIVAESCNIALSSQAASISSFMIENFKQKYTF
jgi:hypothetical protein